MHELSLALNLVEIAEAAAREADAERVEAVHLRLGVFAGVVKDALLFAYDIAVKDTLLEGSRLVIEEVPLVVYCPQCECERELPSMQSFQCPDCGTYTSDLRRGAEMELVSVEIVEHET